MAQRTPTGQGLFQALYMCMCVSFYYICFLIVILIYIYNLLGLSKPLNHYKILQNHPPLPPTLTELKAMVSLDMASK